LRATMPPFFPVIGHARRGVRVSPAVTDRE
jgi:hypothetical protein